MPPTRLAVALAVPAIAALVLAAPASAAVPPAPAAPPAAAGEDFRWAVQPAGGDGRIRFVYTLAAGQAVDDHVLVTNLAKRPITVALYATDAATTTDGAFALLSASRRPTDAGAWIALATPRQTIRAGGQVVLPFRLTVPADATPGDHAAGIIAAVAATKPGADGRAMTVDRRIATRVYLRVPGHLTPAVQVTAVRARYDNPLLPFTTGPMTVTVRLRNAGNVRVNGTATVRTTGPFGVPLGGRDRFALPELLPGAEVELTRRLTGVLPAGMISGTVAVDATSTGGLLPTTTGTVTVWRPPLTIILVLLVGTAVVLRRRRARRAAVPVRTGPIGADTPAPAAR